MMQAKTAGRALALVVLAALSGIPSVARAALSYDFLLGGSVMHTDNLHLDAEPQEEGQREPVAETVYAAAPGVRLEWREGQDLLLASYRGEYWTFTGDEDRDPLWLHDVAAELEWRRWAPYFLASEAVYERVPRYEGDESQSILDQLDRTWLSLRTGVAWPLGTTGTAELAYRGEFENFSGGEEDEDDRIVGHFVEVLVRRRWGPLWESETSARYGEVTQNLAPDAIELGLTASLSRRLSERLSARARAEWVREDPDGSAPAGGDGDGAFETRTNLLGAAELRKELERGGFWSLSYEERLEDEPDGDTLTVGRTAADGRLRARLGSEIGGRFWYEDRDYRLTGRDETAWGPTVTARWMFAPWAALDVAGSWTETTTREPGEEEIEDRTGRAGAALVGLIGRHLVAEAGYVYRENDSTADEDSYTANLYYAAVTYHFGAIPPGMLPASTVTRLISAEENLPAGR